MPTFKTSILGSFFAITILIIAIVSPVTAQTQSLTSGNTGTVNVNVLFNYGNGTSIWVNNTSVPSNANFFNVTSIVTGGNIGAVFFSSFGSHFVYSINGVGCPASNIFCDQAWGFWTLDGICWDLPFVGVDQVTVSQARTVAWFLNPAATFGESPPSGASCVSVNLDLRPGSNQTSINLRSQGVIPVAVLSSTSFNASTVNPLTVKFGRTGTEASPVHWSFTDVNGDGKPDLLLQFRVQSTGIQAGDTQAVLMGRTVDGTPFRGFVTITTSPS